MKLGALCAITLLGAFCALSAAFAAPDRLGDDVPDAIPDQEGALAASYGYQSLQLEGPLNSSSAAQHLFKLRYTFSPDVAGSFRYQTLSLPGGPGMFTPLYDNADGAAAMEFDLALNLLNVAPTPADEAKKVEWAAGSAFGIGLNAARHSIEQGPLAQEDTLLKAYLVYSTDLTDKLRAHTYFSSGRLSGDSHSGSVNRIAAGLDYTITPGCKPLVVMANGVLDVYNFRQPAFNTNRITRFDLGVRYRFAEDWYASLGWTSLNDSENDASGSGLFAGLNFVDEPPCCEPCVQCPPSADTGALPTDPTAPAATPPAQASATSGVPPGQGSSESSAGGSEGLLMAQQLAAPAQESRSAASVPEVAPDQPGTAEQQSDSAGIMIPVLAAEAPAGTPEGALMARAPQPEAQSAAPDAIALATAAPDALAHFGPLRNLKPVGNTRRQEINSSRLVTADESGPDETPPGES